MRSFLKELFLGRLAWDAVSPFPFPSEEERETAGAICDTFRRFAAEKIRPEEIERRKALPEEVRSGLAEAGLLSVTIPEEYGGFGASTAVYLRLVEEMSAVDASVSTTVGAHLSLCAKAVLLGGSEAQKREWLPRLASGEILGAYSLSEPGAGSDARSLRTTADPDGDGFVLNGEKMWVTNGGFAGLVVVFAKTPEEGGRRKITAFLVPRGTAGLQVGREEDKMGLLGSSTVPLHFENARVPASAVLGERGRGFDLALRVLQSGRTSLGAGCVGASRRILQEALRHASQRVQFGRKLEEFEMVRAKFARVAAHLYMMESVTGHAASLLDLGAIDPSLEAASVKVLSTEATWWNLHQCLQVAGGIGFVREYPYERALRDARVNMIFEGANDVLRSLVALTGMRELHRALFGRGETPPPVPPDTLETALPPSLRDCGEKLCRAVGELGAALPPVLRRHGRTLAEREYVQERVADAAMSLYAAAATLSRTEGLVRARGADGALRERELCEAVLDDRLAAFRRATSALADSDDARTDSIASRLSGDGGYRAGLFENCP